MSKQSHLRQSSRSCDTPNYDNPHHRLSFLPLRGYRYSRAVYLDKNTADNLTVPHVSTLRLEDGYFNAGP